MDPIVKNQDEGGEGAGQNLQQPGSGTSATEQLTSLFEEGKQYAGKDIVATVGKVLEDALSADGRVQKDRAEKAEAAVTRLTGDNVTLSTNLNNVTTQVNELIRTNNEAEAEKYKDQPDELRNLRTRQSQVAEKIRQDGIDATQATEKTAIANREAEVAKKETAANIVEAATSAQVDAKELADLVPDGDPERLKRMATILKQNADNKPPAIDPKTGKPVALFQKPASPAGTGAETRTTAEAMLEKAKAKK